jgi:oligopeptide transport system substrate-binding protein
MRQRAPTHEMSMSRTAPPSAPPFYSAMTRRGFTALATVGAGAAAAGCGGAVRGFDPAKRSLDIGNSAEPLSLDPHKASGQWENNVIGNMLMGLTTEDVNADPIPGMATEWTTSEDGLTWTFKLREAKWSDGEPFTAYDFEYAFRRIMNPATIAEYAAILYPVLNAEACKKGDLPIEALGVRAADARTLEIRLEHPAPYLPGLLKHYTAYPVPRHVVEKVGDDWIKPEHFVGNGPFNLDKWWSNYIIHLVKNPNFWDAENVALEHLYFYPTTDDDAAARRIIRGELAWSTNFPGKKQDFYEREIPGFPRLAPFLLLQYFSLNTTKPPFDDARVRRAVSMAVDRDFLANEIWKAGHQPAWSFVPPGIRDYPATARLPFADKPVEERRAEARKLLEAAGYGPNRPFEFVFKHRNTADNPRIAVVVQSDWNQIAPWVKVKLEGSETQIHYASLRAKDFIAGDGGWIADFNDARNYLYLLETRTGPQNYPGFSNPEFDQLMHAADQERDAEKRAQMMVRAEQLMLDESPVVPVAFGTSRNLVHPGIAGWSTNLEDIHRARWMSLKGAGA